MQQLWFNDGYPIDPNPIILKPTGMETHDRGFDAQGNPVWGSTASPITFSAASAPSR